MTERDAFDLALELDARGEILNAFDLALEFVYRWEGGYSRDRRDGGGETNLGISRAAFPNENIPEMTRARSRELYLEHYWSRAYCPEVLASAGVALAVSVFDFAVNSGPDRAVRVLQKTGAVAIDGVVGPVTLGALAALPELELLSKYLASRVEFLLGLNQSYFIKGWLRRVVALGVLAGATAGLTTGGENA